MKIGDIEVAKSIINLEHDMAVLQKIMEFIIRNNEFTDLKLPSGADIENFKSDAFKNLKEKYPNMGIKNNS